MRLASKLPLKPEGLREVEVIEDELLEQIERRVTHLKAVSLFADLVTTEGSLEHLARIMTVRTFKPHDSIIKEGEVGTEMFLLVKGEASVFKSTPDGDQYKVAIIKGEGHAFFGEGGLLDSDSRSATIQADSVCYCLVLSRESYESFGRSHPEWALPVTLRVARAVLVRLRKTNNDLTLLYNALVAEIRGS